ncbi:MAG: hypothetical protein ACOY94_22510 [Bacillota bacterium]
MAAQLFTLARIGLMVILPMILGSLTYAYLQKRYTQEESAATRAPHLLSDGDGLMTGLRTLPAAGAATSPCSWGRLM